MFVRDKAIRTATVYEWEPATPSLRRSASTIATSINSRAVLFRSSTTSPVTLATTHLDYTKLVSFLLAANSITSNVGMPRELQRQFLVWGRALVFVTNARCRLKINEFEMWSLALVVSVLLV